MADGLAMITISGNLGKDPSLHTTKDGTDLSRYSVGVNRRDQTTWYQVAVYGSAAKPAYQHLQKGSEVTVSGDCFLNTWTGNDGSTRSDINVVQRASKWHGGPGQSKTRQQQGNRGDELPFEDQPF